MDRLQFSIKDWFIWTAEIALIIWLFTMASFPQITSMAAVVANGGFLFVVAMWVAQNKQWPYLKEIVHISLVITIGFVGLDSAFDCFCAVIMERQ